MTRPPFRAFIDKDADAKLRSEVPDFLTPYRALEVYRRTLIEKGLISDFGYGWTFSPQASMRWERRLEEDRQWASNLQSIKRFLEDILGHLTADERYWFDEQAWWNTSPAGLALTVSQVFEERATSEYWTLRSALHGIQAMLAGTGEPVDELACLPIEVLRQEAIEQKERLKLARLRQAEEARISELCGIASCMLADAQTWLETPQDAFGGLKPVDLARQNAEGLGHARSALERIVQKRAHQQQAERRHQECLDELRMRAVRAFGPNHSDLFLNSAHPRLGGMRPADYAVDKTKLAHCLELLPKSTRRMHSPRRRYRL